VLRQVSAYYGFSVFLIFVTTKISPIVLRNLVRQLLILSRVLGRINNLNLQKEHCRIKGRKAHNECRLFLMIFKHLCLQECIMVLKSDLKIVMTY